MRWHRFDCADLPTMPWKNGGGVTREVVCQPPGANMEDFDWRVSIAAVASDGPFSSFSGIDRVITLLEGGGMHLASDDSTIDHRLDTPLQPFAFPGEARVHARLLAGACEDFNVMARRATCRAEVRILRHASEVSAPQGLLLATQGVWSVQPPHEDAHALPVQLGLWWQADATNPDTSWQLHPQTPGASLLAVTIHPLSATPS
ncbi:MAG: hypothetical protein RI884_420 [Pseudomonadota bacterium]|jgi:environmental stress-induced protein Ves